MPSASLNSGGFAGFGSSFFSFGRASVNNLNDSTQGVNLPHRHRGNIGFRRGGLEGRSSSSNILSRARTSSSATDTMEQEDGRLRKASSVASEDTTTTHGYGVENGLNFLGDASPGPTEGSLEMNSSIDIYDYNQTRKSMSVWPHTQILLQGSHTLPWLFSFLFLIRV